MTEIEIRIEDPHTADIVELLEAHLAFAVATTEPENVHALDIAALVDPAIHFHAARVDGLLLAVGALKELGDGHAEIKSMHTAEQARRTGVARRFVEQLLSFAAELGCDRVSLETGSQEAFAPARALYASVGFEPCGPFGDYPDVATSAFMTRRIPT